MINGLFSTVLADWSIGGVLNGATNSAKNWGAAFITLVGIVCVVCAIIFLVKKLTTQQPGGMGKVIGFAVVGGLCLVFGLTGLMSVTNGVGSSVHEFGGTILPLLL